MVVYVVTKSWYSERDMADYFHTVGAYSTKEKARAVQMKIENEMLLDDNECFSVDIQKITVE